jgi:nicotinamide mononucleotide transporter
MATMHPLEIAAVAISALGVWLTTRRKLSSWPVTLAACALYAAVFYQAKLYSDMLLQGVYAAMSLYGWWHWLRGVREEGTVRVESLPARGWLLGALAGVAASYALGHLMAHYTDAALPYMDAGLTSFSLVAQWWTTRRYVANWTLWIAVDAIYTGMFLYKGLQLTAGLYAFFIVLAMLGLRSWRAAQAEQAAESTAAAR